MMWPKHAVVVGNGPGPAPLAHGSWVARFNRAVNQALEEANLWVNNAKSRGLNQAFVTEGEAANDALNKQLAALAKGISKQLGCWSSSGVTLLHLLSEQDVAADVHRMPLLPSLERPSHYSPRQPLACSFHNWLGERRLALTGSLRVAIWPSLFIPAIPGHTTSRNPFSLLKSLAGIADRTACKAILEEIANLGSQGWLTWATPEQLQSTEPLFHLSRHQQQTANWWLFDNEASPHINRIYRSLAWCQQHCY